RPPGTGAATLRRIPGARVRSQGLLSGVVGNTGFEASPSASVANLLRVIGPLHCARPYASIGALSSPGGRRVREESAMQGDAKVVNAALDTLEQSTVCVRENRRLFSETRYRIAASRRRLNPAFAFTGAADEKVPDALRQSIRARLASGALFPVGSRVTAGNGSGNLCVVCRNRVDRYEIEYEIALGEGV